MMKMEVLVVEDEAELNECMCTLLKLNGFRAIGALNPLDAEEILLEHRPSLVISDLKMPHSSGLELLQKLRKQGLPCAFVLLSGHDENKYLSEAMRLGALDYVIKPFDTRKFFSLVSIWLEIGKRLQLLADETDSKNIQRQLKMIERFRLRCSSQSEAEVA